MPTNNKLPLKPEIGTKASAGTKSWQRWAINVLQKPFIEWYSLWDTTSLFYKENSMCNQTTNLAKFSGPRSTSYGHIRGGRGCCGRTNLHSLLQALAIDPGLSENQKRSTTLPRLTKSSTRVGGARWFGVGSWKHRNRPCIHFWESEVEFSSLTMPRLLWNLI